MHRLLILVAAGTGLTGCTASAPSLPAAPPPSVTVSLPLRREVTDYAEYTGRTAAVNAVEVRARVSGYLQKVHFKEGTDVNEGDVLYEIDPRPYQAALNQAQAQIALQEANLKFQDATYQRNRRLVSSGAVTQEELQQSEAQRDTAQAQLNAAKAAVETARLNLDWTKITSPITGVIGRTFLTEGNLVVADQTLLTTVVSQDPMFVYFDVDEPTVLRVQELIRLGKFRSAREEGVRVPVWLGLATEEDYPHEGKVDFINNQVVATTGTLPIRGSFPNPKPPTGPRLLTPGLFVRVRVAVSAPYQALLVTQGVVGTDQNLKFVYVVGGNDRVERRDVRLGHPQGNDLQVIL
jgi:multidrug efflux system membrane fusion protein